MAGHAMTWGETATEDDKIWGAIAHVSVFAAAFIGPLVLLLLFQEKSKFVRYHCIQALVFQAVLYVVSMVISVIAVVSCGIGSFLYLFLIPLGLVPLWGAWVAYEGKWEGWPGTAAIGR